MAIRTGRFAGAFGPISRVMMAEDASGGALVDLHDDDPRIVAQRRLHEAIAAEPRVSATTIQTVGGKGYDGFTLALVGG